MPKLSADVAREAEKAAEEGGPQPLPEGLYIARLFAVDVSDDQGPSGYHWWIWKFKIEDEGYAGREIWTNTSLSPKARFSIGGMFTAFGKPADTDTDELIGDRIKLQINQTVIGKGKRQGQIGNEVQYAMPLEDGDESTPLDKVGDF